MARKKAEKKEKVRIVKQTDLLLQWKAEAKGETVAIKKPPTTVAEVMALVRSGTVEIMEGDAIWWTGLVSETQPLPDSWW